MLAMQEIHGPELGQHAQLGLVTDEMISTFGASDELGVGVGFGTAAYLYFGLAALSASASAYHGYKRHESAGAAVGWGLLGFLFPVVTPLVGLAQGFAQPE